MDLCGHKIELQIPESKRSFYVNRIRISAPNVALRVHHRKVLPF